MLLSNLRKKEIYNNLLSIDERIKNREINNLAFYISNELLINGVPTKNLINIFERAIYLNDVNIINSKKKFRKDSINEKNCEICGSSEHITVHHIKKISTHRELRLCIDNVMILCLECHKLIHNNVKNKKGR